MKKLIIVIFLIIPLSAQAQEWTPEQREVIAAIKECWEGWNKAEQEKNPDNYFGECGMDDSLFWWAERTAPHSVSEYRDVMAKGLTSWTLKRWDVLTYSPLFVQIEGDFAFIYFAPIIQEEDTEGKVTVISQKRLEVYRKIDGRWRFFTGMSAPADSH